MLVFFSILIIIISALFFLIGYAYFHNRAEDLLMWSLTGKIEKIRDKEGYKKIQGKYSILMGIFFLTFPITVYLVKSLNINPNFLYLWLFLFAFTIVLNAIQVRKFY